MFQHAHVFSSSASERLSHVTHCHWWILQNNSGNLVHVKHSYLWLRIFRTCHSYGYHSFVMISHKWWKTEHINVRSYAQYFDNVYGFYGAYNHPGLARQLSRFILSGPVRGLRYSLSYAGPPHLMAIGSNLQPTMDERMALNTTLPERRRWCSYSIAWWGCPNA